MDDEDEVDILGEVQEDTLLPEASGFDGMGLNLAELLPELGPNSWLLSSNQSWNLDNDIEVRSKAQTDFPVKQEVSCESLNDESLECAKIQKHRKYWSNEEKEIFLEGFKLYGNKWSKISKLLGSRTTLQVKSFARQFLKQGSLPHKKLALDDFSSSWQEQEIEKLDSEISPNLNQLLTTEESKTETVSEKTEIVRLHRENSLSDNEDIDIEGLAEEKDVDQCARIQTISKNTIDQYRKNEDTDGGYGSPPRQNTEPDSFGIVEEEAFEHSTSNDFATFQFEKPTDEVKLERNSTTLNEKLVHNEFFQGRPQKTPERYLKIRNYILDSWDKCKPQYLNKTSVRPGLKNCGDVNCIGRIHSYLEQIGAINFGCEQTIYQTILVDGSKKLPTTSTTKKSTSTLNKQFERGESARQRKRKIPDLSNVSDNHGYTIEHGDNGEIVDVAAIVKSQKRKKSFASNPFHLLPCFEFSLTKPAPYAVEVDVRAVFAMDVHAHMSSLEVIGLLGGRYDFNTSILHVLTAEPCRSVSTGLECEMDPVSQTIASDKIQQEGFLIVGWYHSHPNFQPNPSVRDLDTQTKFQQWFSHGGTPFLGVIISPHLISSPFSKFRYLMVDIESDAPTAGYHQPFKFMPTFVWEYKETSRVEDDFICQIQPLQETSIDYKISLPSVKKVISGTHRHLVLAGADYKLRTDILTNIGKKLVDMANQEERHGNLSELVSEECAENLI